jgi:hypothetical protein
VITRVYRGHHTAGLVAYLYGPGRHEDHREQHLVASWDGNTTALEASGFDAATMTEAQVRQHALAIARALDLPLPACDHDPQHVYHLVLRNPAADRVLTDAEWAQVAVDMMDRTGIAPAGDDLGCRWVLVRHGADHVHLVATLARQDGRRPRLFKDFGKLRTGAREWEARLGLTGTAGVDRTAAGAPTIAETKKAERFSAAARSPSRHAATGGTTSRPPVRNETPKTRLARAVHAGAARAHDLDSFRAALAQAGVQLHLRHSEVRPEEVTGVSFSIAGHETAAGDPIRYSGSKLAPDLGWRHLQARWTGGEATGDPAAADAQPRGGEQVWQEAESILREAAAQVRAEQTGAAADPADAGGTFDDVDDVAWAAADVAYGFAWFMEGARGGRHTAAADALARAGRIPGAGRPAGSSAGRALRGMARTLSARQGRRGAGGAGRLMAAMSDLAAAVAQRRTAQARLAQAHAARAAQTHYQDLQTGSAAAAAWGPFARPDLRPGQRTDQRPAPAPRPRGPGDGRGPTR